MSAPPDVVLAVREALDGRPRTEAMTGAELLAHVEIVVGRRLSLRRVGEAVENLRAQGLPICSTSQLGYWHAQTPEEWDETVAESRRRALSVLSQHRRMVRIGAELRGQMAVAGRSA